jgi:hypothetical protein
MGFVRLKKRVDENNGSAAIHISRALKKQKVCPFAANVSLTPSSGYRYGHMR